MYFILPLAISPNSVNTLSHNSYGNSASLLESSDDFDFVGTEYFVGTDEAAFKYYSKNVFNITKSFIYCPIAKSGSSFWKSVLSAMLNVDSNDQKYSTLTSNISVRHKLINNNNIYRFVFIRDPLERAHSAYMDKCYGFSTYAKRHCMGTLHNRHMSFKDFTVFIWNQYTKYGIGKINGHWMPQSFYCELHKYSKLWNIYQLGNTQHVKYIIGNISMYDKYYSYATQWFDNRNVTNYDIWMLQPLIQDRKAKTHINRKNSKQKLLK
eukprot:240330_1